MDELHETMGIWELRRSHTPAEGALIESLHNSPSPRAWRISMQPTGPMGRQIVRKGEARDLAMGDIRTCRLLYEVARAMLGRGPTQMVLERAGLALKERMGLQRLWLVMAEAEGMEPFTLSLPDGQEGPFPLDMEGLMQLMTTGAGLLDHSPLHGAMGMVHTRSIAAAPVVRQNRLVGMLVGEMVDLERGPLQLQDAAALMLIGHDVGEEMGRRVEERNRRHLEARTRRELQDELEAEREAHEQARVRLSHTTVTTELGRDLVHEVFNLLQPMILLGPLSRDNSDRPELARDLALMARASEDAVRLLRDFRNEARNALHTCRIETIELRAQVVQCVSRMACDLHFCHVDFAAEVQGMGTVNVDRTRLNQILINLLRNGAQAALEAHPEGGAARVTVVEAPAESDHRVLLVHDNGIGIAPSVLSRLFQRNATARIGGNGLGLFIARQLMAEMGGSLELEHTGPQGTTFKLRLRIA